MEYLEPINETSYLSVPNAQVYRKIMRCFYREYEKMNFQLYKEDVFKVLKEDELFEDYSMDQLVLDLNALVLCLQRSFLIIRTTLTGEQQRDFFLCMPSVSGRNGDCRKIPMSGGSFWRMWELYRTIFLPRFMSEDSD